MGSIVNLAALKVTINGIGKRDSVLGGIMSLFVKPCGVCKAGVTILQNLGSADSIGAEAVAYCKSSRSKVLLLGLGESRKSLSLASVS